MAAMEANSNPASAQMYFLASADAKEGDVAQNRDRQMIGNAEGVRLMCGGRVEHSY